MHALRDEAVFAEAVAVFFAALECYSSRLVYGVYCGLE
jgi:hypothetical protein